MVVRRCRYEVRVCEEDGEAVCYDESRRCVFTWGARFRLARRVPFGKDRIALCQAANTDQVTCKVTLLGTMTKQYIANLISLTTSSLSYSVHSTLQQNCDCRIHDMYISDMQTHESYFPLSILRTSVLLIQGIHQMWLH